MKSIKPGRGPSAMSFIGSSVAIIFGVFWTILTASMTAGVPIVGIFFPLFGILFIIVGISQAVYNYKNATGKSRYSTFDITDSTEEGDPSDKWIKDGNKGGKKEVHGNFENTQVNFCPYCGVQLESEYKYCPKCGQAIK